jgi:serine/threonine protein kinase
LQQPAGLFEGKYEILGKIREGGMGTVYRVRHRLLDEIRVVKVMRPRVVGDPEMRRRFLEEAKVATRFKHPNICTIHDFSIDEDGTAYLVMEYIDGINLSDLLRSSGCPKLPLTLEIAHQALLALGYLHRKHVVHRDVAPDNLMLTEDEARRPLVKLIDLGIAKATDEATNLTATGVFLGKLRYASPEQYGRLPVGERLDGRSDLYGLGVVLYELLTGRPPFAGDTPAELLHAHLIELPQAFSESDPGGRVPEELRAVVLKALEKKREDRHATAEEFDRAIAAVRERLSRPDELDETMAMLSTIRDTAPTAAGTFTPSAEGRINRQFSPDSTPQPTPSFITAARTGQTGGSGADAVPGSAPPTRAAPGHGGLLRTIGVSAAVSIAVALFAMFLLRRTRATPSPELAASQPVATAVATPREDAVEAPTPAPTPDPVAGAAMAPPAPAAEDGEIAHQEAEGARAEADRARRSALRERAPEVAGALYAAAVRKQREAERLFARGDFPAARSAFDEAIADFEGAASWSAAHRPAPGAPAERVAALSAPTPLPRPAAQIESAPAPTVPPHAAAPEPTRVPAAPAHAPVPPPAPREVRSAPSDEDRIRAVLLDYQRAQNTLDVDLFAHVYPSLVGRQRQDLERAWQGLARQEVELEIRQIEVHDSHATVRVYQSLVAAPRIGSELHDARNRTIRLEKRGEAWVITGFD